MPVPKLLQRTAADIMQRDVVTASRGNTLREAMEIMSENHVNGLPVMDEHAHCVGLISVTDIIDYEQDHSEDIDEGNSEAGRYYDPDSGQWESVRLSTFALEALGEVRVEDVMASDLISVEKETPIVEVARIMHKSGVHRALVMDDRQQLFGIVSSSDFVRLIAEA